MIAEPLKKYDHKEVADLQPRLWVSRYADYLFAFAILRINNADQARDLVQDTFLAALENASSFEKKSSEKTWLTGILKNKIYDFYRKEYKALKTAKEIPDPYFRKEDGHWIPEYRPEAFGSGECKIFEAKEHQKQLLACIRKLPAAWQLTFMLKHIEDLKTSSICEQLNLTPANFWVIMHRAKVNLRACLQKHL